MVKSKNKLFLVLMAIGLVLTLSSCLPNGYAKLKLEASYTLAVGEQIDAEPVVMTNDNAQHELVYESTDEKVVVYQDGKLTGLSEGSTTIKAYLKDNPNVYATSSVTVTEAKEFEITFDKLSQMVVGDKVQIKYTSAEDDIDVTYRSLDELVATVDEAGMVVAKGVGKTQIVATVTSKIVSSRQAEYKIDVEVVEKVYTITYELNGGTNNAKNPNTFVKSDLPLVLEAPTKDDYEFAGWYLNKDFNGNEVKEISSNTVTDIKLYAKWTPKEYTITYEIDKDVVNDVNPTKYDVTKLPITLEAPTRKGYKFTGWYLNGELVEVLDKISGNITLTAEWEKMDNTLIVDKNDDTKYQSLEDALADASEGATILIAAGTYEGNVTVSVNNILIQGANASKNPNVDTREDETIFTGDLIVAAENVTLDGICFTGKGHVVGSSTKGFKALTIKNVYFNGLTLNENNSSINGAVYLVPSSAQVTFEDLVIENVKFDGSQLSATHRPMFIYGGNMVNLTIKNSSFVGNSKNANDFNRTDTTSSFTIKGNVDIISNHLENFAQYLIWFAKYGEGNYNILNNTFKNSGSYDYNAGVSFATYIGSTSGKVNINVKYNTMDGGYRVLRIDKVNAYLVAAPNIYTAVASYNIFINSKASHYIQNEYTTFTVDASWNYFEGAAPDPAKLVGVAAVGDKYYTDINAVPKYQEE